MFQNGRKKVKLGYFQRQRVNRAIRRLKKIDAERATQEGNKT